MTEPAPVPSTDFGAGTPSPAAGALVEQELKVALDSLLFRRFAFGAGLVVTAVMYGALLFFIFCRAWVEIGHERLILSGILGTIPTIILLALIRFAFAEKNKKDAPEDLSIWAAFLKEIGEAIKTFAQSRAK